MNGVNTINEVTEEFTEQRTELMTRYRSNELSHHQIILELQKLTLEAKKQYRIADQASGELTISFIYANRGMYVPALTMIRHAQAKFEDIEDYDRIASCYIAAGEIYRSQNKWAQAEEAFQRAVEAAEVVDAEANRMFAMGNRGHVALAMGEYDKARDLLVETLQIIEEKFANRKTWLTSVNEVRCEYGSALAEVLFHVGDYDACWEQTQAIYELAVDGGQELELAYVHRVISLLWLAGYNFGEDDRVKSFEYHITTATDIFERLNSVLDMAKVLELHADGLAAAGDRVAALKYIDRAIKLYHRLHLVGAARKAAVKRAKIKHNEG